MSSMPPQSEQDSSSPIGLRSGAQYLAQIRDDGRQVTYDGEVVKDVASHPAFRGAAQSIAGLWDIAADPKNRELMTYESPRTGNQCSAAIIFHERSRTSLRSDT
jgi:aromatic ring hydroxylase